ncbi:MAG: carbonic anhydrase family protein [Caldilineaceae bacterium]|nr:carbonic anhydrase family protein [Caldilineaceae bacterium]
MLRRLLLGSSGLFLVLVTACQPIQLPEAAATPAHASAPASPAHTIHWSYAGEEGPDHWGELSADYTACADGSAQSPIDLTAATKADLPDIIFDYGESHLNILNNGHTVQVNYDAGSAILLDGVRYDLLQFHFHAASEHTIAGERYPLEFHLVHRNAEGGLAVVGVMAVAGAENPAFADILAHAPASEAAATVVEGVMVAAEQLLPAGRLYYTYAGSLTTPPCSEGVKWHVLTTPIELSATQLEALTSILHDNFRPIQPLHDRALQLDTTGG